MASANHYWPDDITHALGVPAEDAKGFYARFSLEKVEDALVLHIKNKPGPVGWYSSLRRLPRHEIVGALNAFRRELCETIQAIGDPKIHAAGDLLTDQLRAIREAFLEQRRDLESLREALQEQVDEGAVDDMARDELAATVDSLRATLRRKEESNGVMLAAAAGILAVGRAIQRKAPGDEELKGALDHLEETIGELVP